MIWYTIVDTSFGRLFVAATERGICWVGLGDSDGALIDEMKSDGITEAMEAGDRLADWTGALQAYLRGEAGLPDLPLDVTGTVFQQNVWSALRAIPSGETRTYTQIAQAIGKPKAVRAVGRACATNPAALVIPCHRVVAIGGSLAGFRWGVERKQRLIALESSIGE